MTEPTPSAGGSRPRDLGPTGFAFCPECKRLWVNVLAETLVHSCVAHSVRIDTLAELFDWSDEARAERRRRIKASMVEVPVHWAEKAWLQP